jgi:phosphatidylglycerophosphate synthase
VRSPAEQAQTSSSVRAASSRSRSVTPPAEWVVQRTVTRLYEMAMSGWWFSLSATSARRRTNSIAAGKLSNSSVRSSAPSTSGQDTTRTLSRLARSRKRRQGKELVCELVFRPLAHLVVLALLPLRVPPPAVVLAAASTGVVAAVEIARGHLLAAALLLQLKTLLDNADGQLARLSGRVTAFGRYLDSECDLLVDAAVFAALGLRIGPWLALGGFTLLTLLLGVNYNVERLYRREHLGIEPPAPPAEGAAGVLARAYGVVYAWQDRLVEGYAERRLRGRDRTARRAWHDAATVGVVANFGLSTQLAALGLCLALGAPAAYVGVLAACTVVLALLALRRDLVVRQPTSEEAWNPTQP